MKKSNKISLFYVVSSLSLFLVLMLGGVYGLYVSVGLSFMRSSVSNIADVGAGGVSNVSFGGSVNFTQSMTGVIILSIVLVVLSVIDFINLIKQITFFKQFKLIKNSSIEKGIERKVKSKKSVIVWTILIDLVSFVIGIVGFFMNNNAFAPGNNRSWIFYVIDVLVVLFALLSFVLLIVKLKDKSKNSPNKNYVNSKVNFESDSNSKFNFDDINRMEYDLMKLNTMKNSKMISDAEFKRLRKRVILGGIGIKNLKNTEDDN